MPTEILAKIPSKGLNLNGRDLAVATSHLLACLLLLLLFLLTTTKLTIMLSILCCKDAIPVVGDYFPTVASTTRELYRYGHQISTEYVLSPRARRTRALRTKGSTTEMTFWS